MAQPISASSGFLHVQDSYRWLAALTCCFESLRDLGKGARWTIYITLPNVDVGIQAGVLVYARGIIEFFGPATGRLTDLRVANFGVDRAALVALDARDDLDQLIKSVKPSIDQHLAHLTAFRDAEHPERDTHPRLDWNVEIPIITDRLERVLGLLIDPANRDLMCREAFVRLHEAAQARRRDPSYLWPTIEAADDESLLDLSLPPLTPEQLDAFASEHVKYEVQMLIGASCRQYDLARPEVADQLGVWACLESALFHLRNVRVFLLEKGTRNEVVARDYLPDWRSRLSSTPSEPIRARLAAATEPLNEHLAHLTRTRLDTHFEWDTPGACDDVLEMLGMFRATLAAAALDRATAFDWLDDLAELWTQARPAVDRFIDDDGQLVVCRRTAGA